MAMWFYRWASLRNFYRYSGKLLPYLACIAIPLFIYGLVNSLLLAPPDQQQGEGYRILYIHVPCAFLSLTVYTTMAIFAFAYLIWRIKIADILLKACAPIGAMFTALALITGSLWGKPMWGTWWIWDARLTSELILLFIYAGIMGLQAALPERENQAALYPAILTLVGVVNIPIIHYSVRWWQTLHQGATLQLFGKSQIASSMLSPLLWMLSAFCMYTIIAVLQRARCEILSREQSAYWVKHL